METLGTHPEVRELRRTMRDLVALSAIPGAWVGRGLREIAKGSVDVLMGVLDVSLAFIRLGDFGNGEQSEAIYDPEHTGFADWVREQEANSRSPQRNRVLNFDLSGRRLRVAFLPLGLNSASGLMAIASTCAEFPSEFEMLLASVVANHAATAFRVACLRLEAEVERRRLEELLEQAPAAIGLLNGPDHRWPYVNDLYIRVTGRESARDFIGKTLRESLPEIEGQGFIELLDQVYATGEPFIGREMKVRLNRGPDRSPEQAYFDFVYQPIHDAGGKTSGILVHAIEMTEKVEGRRALWESQRRFKALVTATSYSTYRMSPDWSEMRQLDGSGFLADTRAPNENWLEDYILREDRPQVIRTIQEAIEGKCVFELEHRVRKLDGSVGWTLSRAVPILDENGQIIEWFGAATDVTEQVRARSIMEETQDRLRSSLVASRQLAAIVESSDDAIVSKDLNGIVTSWNRRAEQMFGFSAEEMIGQPILKIIPDDLQPTEQEILATISRGERIEHFETIRRTKSRELLEVSLTISPMRDETGKIVGASKIARDITQRKKTERALRTTERLASVGRLAATVAHEMNNPLEAVTNLVYLAQRSSSLSDVKDLLARVDEELGRVSLITKQTLGFYRETKGASATHLGALVQPLISILEARSRNKSITIDTEIRQDPEIYCVAGEIRQLFANLLGNSIDAVSNGGRIKVRVSANREHRGEFRSGVRLTVADSGPGISPAVKRRLFEPFFTTKQDVGTGLGLWISKNIVDNHGGSICVKSCVVPRRSWTIFSVFLPAEPRAPIPTSST